VAVDHAEHDPRQRDKYFSGRDDPESLVGKPTQRRRQFRVIDNHTGHRQTAQPVDAEIAEAFDGVLLTTEHLRAAARDMPWPVSSRSLALVE
jgi:hypothetical protein